MNIEKHISNTMKFKDIKDGTVFYSYGFIAMKIEARVCERINPINREHTIIINAVYLDDGKTYHMDDNENVTIIDGKFVYEER